MSRVQCSSEAAWRSGALSRESGPLQVSPWVRGGLGVGDWIPRGSWGSTVQAARVAARRGARKERRAGEARWEASRQLLGDPRVHRTLNPPLRVPLLLSPTPNRDGPRGHVRHQPLLSWPGHVPLARSEQSPPIGQNRMRASMTGGQRPLLLWGAGSDLPTSLETDTPPTCHVMPWACVPRRTTARPCPGACPAGLLYSEDAHLPHFRFHFPLPQTTSCPRPQRPV